MNSVLKEPRHGATDVFFYWEDKKIFKSFENIFADISFFPFSDWKKCTSTFDCSERAVQGYMERYATLSRIGHTPTCEDFARIHNGGPNGFKNPNTLEYWEKVKACLQGGVFK